MTTKKETSSEVQHPRDYWSEFSESDDPDESIKDEPRTESVNTRDTKRTSRTTSKEKINRGTVKKRREDTSEDRDFERDKGD